MLLVPTYLDKSPINGIGLFALTFIPKRTVIWEYTNFLDRTYSKYVVENMPESNLKNFVKKYCYLDDGSWPVYVLCVDDARFMNHSIDPNTSNGEGWTTVANRDIQIGEEITCNYYEIDDAASKFQLCNTIHCALSSHVGKKISLCEEKGCPFQK